MKLSSSKPNPINTHQNGDVSEHSSKNSVQKSKSDLEHLSDHKGMEEYEGMPVEGYGAALLSGYGWYPGRGIGRNAKEDVKVVEYTKTTHRHGLGFRKNSNKKKDKIHVLLDKMLADPNCRVYWRS